MPIEETIEEKPAKQPVKLMYKIETNNGIYTVKRPVGRAGVQHFTLVTKSIPTSRDEDGNPIVSPADQDRFTSCFDEWTQKVLPQIYVDGPTKPAEMPGEDQYALFLAMFQTVNLGGGSDLFRFVE